MNIRTTAGIKDIELIPMPEVENIVHYKKSAIYAKIAAGDFPTAYQCGSKRMWDKEEVTQWKNKSWTKPIKQDKPQDKKKLYESV